MRFFPYSFISATLCLLPAPVLADVFVLDSSVTDVTLYDSFAKVTRRASFEIPAGTHSLQLLDMPEDLEAEGLQFKVSGAQMGALRVRQPDHVPPRPDQESDALKAARAEVERWQDIVAQKSDEIQSQELLIEAAEAEIDFLVKLGNAKTLEGTTPQQLRETAQMVGEETLNAKKAMQAATIVQRALNAEMLDLQQSLDEAEQSLRALVPEGKYYSLLQSEVFTEAATTGEVEVTYLASYTKWTPTYDAFLTLGETNTLELKRSAWLSQSTGENWDNVTLTLSTSQPGRTTSASEIYAQRLKIIEKTPPTPKHAEMLSMNEEPVVFAETAASSSMLTAHSRSLDGLVFNYTFPQKVSLASGAEGIQIDLSDFTFAPDVTAVGVPQYDDTAFLQADFTNTSGELLMPSGLVQLYLNGEFVGVTEIRSPIAANAETHLSFGAIEGLRLSRLLDRNQGDRGILNKSNQRVEAATLKVENLTGRNWMMRVLDRVPYSEQEDLVIDWTAQPTPTVTDYADRKGVLAWEFEIDASATWTAQIENSVQWPEDMILR